MKLRRSLTASTAATARLFAFTWIICALTTMASAQVRVKKPDRSVYESPRLTTVKVESASPPSSDSDQNRDQKLQATEPDESVGQPKLQRVAYEEASLSDPITQQMGSETIVQSGPVYDDNRAYYDEGSISSANLMHDGCDGCDGCVGCDSIGSCSSHGWANSSLSFSRDQWFGSLELLLMFRSGDRLPPLVTTGPDTDPDTAGELGQTGTVILAGGDTVLKDMTAGGRLTLGTWLDGSQCRSLVFRGWGTGNESYGFSSNQDQISVLARPFFNVSDNQAAEQDTQLIAFPDRSLGSIDVRADSEVFGGDISVRQFWYGRFGGTVDVLYGYQYMRLNEDLNISSTSTSLDDDFAPVGSVLSIADSFDVSNEFHGAQLGLASRYREGCWSFNSLAKVAFGSLRRRSNLSGSTFTSIDGANATDPNGLLVRSTNSGVTTDHTFGWVPELDLSLGWHRFPCYDITVGYHLIAMTDALQVSGTIDQSLAVNLSDPPTGQQSPAPMTRDDTFYVQGIHFGLQYIY